jgi:hypothetical protein
MFNYWLLGIGFLCYLLYLYDRKASREFKVKQERERILREAEKERARLVREWEDANAATKRAQVAEEEKRQKAVIRKVLVTYKPKRRV